MAIKVVFFFGLVITTLVQGQPSELLEKLKSHKISIIEINTTNSQPIISKEVYLKAGIRIYDSKNNFNVTIDSTEIKGRGNSTWEMPKKPFRLKLFKARSIGGMPTNRHWALLANYEDKAASRTKLASDLGIYLGMAYTPRSIPVELILNGSHLGSYQLIEVPKIDPNRINITSINTKNDIVSGGVIFELNSRLDEIYNFYSNAGVPISIKDPDDLNAKSSEMITTHLDYLINTLNSAEDALFSNTFTDIDRGYAKYFNVESVIDFYLTIEILKNIDIGEYSVYKYIDTRNNNKITYGPIWDFDLSVGNREDPYGFKAKQENKWFHRFFEDPNFEKKVKEKWVSKRNGLLSAMTSSINQYSRSIMLSQKENEHIWEYTRRWDDRSFSDDVNFMKNWLYERFIWLDKQWSDNPIFVNPVVYDKYFTIEEDSKLSNNLDAYGSTNDASFFILKKPSKGVIEFLNDQNGEFTYIPFENVNGIDSFYFTKAIPRSSSIDTGMVVVVINPKNDPPVVYNVNETVAEDNILERKRERGLRKFSFDIEGDSLFYQIIDSAKHGKLYVEQDGSITYTPYLNFNGIDSFSFKASDAIISSNTATFIIQVTPVNDAPVTSNFIDSVLEDENLQKLEKNGLRKYAFDVEGDPLRFRIIETTKHGKLVVNPDGSFNYIPSSNYFGIDSFSFIADDTVLISNISYCTIHVLPVNDPPVVAKDTIFYQVFSDEKITLNSNSEIIQTVSDVDDKAEEITLIYNSKAIKGNIIKEGEAYVYYPAANFTGIDILKFKASDKSSISNEGSIVIRVLSKLKNNNHDNVLLYPNPNTGQFYIDNLIADKAFILDLNGKKLENIQLTQLGSKLYFQINYLKPGTYILYLIYKNKIISVKKLILNL